MLKNKINPDDYAARFQDTICRYKGEPYRVMVESRSRFTLIPINGRGEMIHINPKDENFDVSSIPMGYMNHNGTAVSCVRTSRRRYTQGVTQRNVSFYSVSGQELPNGAISIYSGAVHEMVMGNYPKIENILKSLRSGSCTSMAGSRRIAFEINRMGVISIYVMYRMLGWIPPEKDYVVVEDSKISSILCDELRELGLNIKQGRQNG